MKFDPERFESIEHETVSSTWLARFFWLHYPPKKIIKIVIKTLADSTFREINR